MAVRTGCGMVIIREPKHGEASNSTNGKGKASLFSFSFCLRAVVKLNFKPALILGGLADEACIPQPSKLVPAPGNIYATPLRFKLSGHPVLSARFNVETAGSERKRPEI